MRKVLFITSAVVAAATAGVLGAPAAFADTPITFDVTGGTLAVAEPASADIGSAAAGTASLAGQLGAVTVTDDRAGLDATWTADVIATDFTTGGGTTAETIPASDVSYSPGAATATTGSATFDPGAGGAIDTSQPAFTATAATGINSATWNPTVTITLPAAVVAGTYSGTVTHSVA